MRKEKVLSEAQHCTKCLGRLVRRDHSAPSKPSQSYYFRWFLQCTECGTLYMTEAAKRPWPPRSLEVADRFQAEHMRLMPLIDGEVQTPVGAGKLIHVLGPREVYVLLEGQRFTTRFRADEITPKEQS